MADAQQTTIWVDLAGRTRATYVRALGSTAGIQAALLAFSCADVQRSWEGPPAVNPAPAPIAGAYQTVADYAVLLFSTAAGDLVYLTLVAPQSSIFMADQETVDPVAIATLIAVCLAALEDQQGNPVTAFVGGYRRRSGREYQ